VTSLVKKHLLPVGEKIEDQLTFSKVADTSIVDFLFTLAT